MPANQANGPQVVILEGSIGAGKSTFLELLEKHLAVQAVQEPLKQWQDVGGGNLLDNFYKDPSRWAYTFQSYAFISRIFEQRENLKTCIDKFQILERSVYSDRYCFAKNCHENGVMSELEWSLYKDLFAWFVDELTVFPAAFIYLQTSPEVCYERVSRRSRSEESVVALEYLKQIHGRHEEWIVNKIGVSEKLAKVPTLVLNVDKDFESDPVFARELCEKVAKLLRDIGNKNSE